MTIREKRVERRKLWEQAKAILDTAEAENRALTAEEEEHYDKLENDIDAIQVDIEKIEADNERRAKIEAVGVEMSEPEAEAVKPEAETGETVRERATPEYEAAFRQFLKDGRENRALQMDSDIAGGYTVVSEQFVNMLIKDLDDSVFMRGIARTFDVMNAESLGAPSLDNDPADPTWTAEILTGDEDSTMTFGNRSLTPHPLAQRIKVSKKLVRTSALGIENVVRQRLAYKIGIVEENAFLNGSGASEPLGVFTASADGISTSRDVSTDNTITNIKADNLIENKYNLKAGYWRNARWIFHRDAVKMIRKLKDGDGQYLWKAGISNDRGDTILDIPVVMSEYAPNTFTTGLYVGIIGDFSYYWIATALNMTIQVLTELYAETNQNGYISRLEADGMPVLENAFSRVTLA